MNVRNERLNCYLSYCKQNYKSVHLWRYNLEYNRVNIVEGDNMQDGRTALRYNSVIEVPGKYTIHIRDEIGRGAGSIVYNAEYKDSIGIGHKIRVKECYPVFLLMKRDGDRLISLEEDKTKFSDALSEFIETYKKSIDIKNTIGLVNSTVNSSDIVRYNNTVYIVMSLDEGKSYCEYEDTSLKELFIHIKCLAEIIQKYHQNGYLHLDIKPENIFVIPETPEHILLFDFSSIVSTDELKNTDDYILSYSEGFSAPEQIRGKINDIGFHSDIFSIGALAFYKLFGRKAEMDDCKISSEYQFEDMKFASDKIQPVLYRLLKLFFHKTISVSTIPRWKNMQQVIDILDDIIAASDIEQIYLVDNFQYNSSYFTGRQKELREIEDILSKDQLVFLSGIGGIGKTELAKYYAYVYREKYDTVSFCIYEKDIKTLVNNEIIINKISIDEEEKEEEYYKRKIEILRKNVTEKDLIIIDNFDTDYDEELERLLSCPCKFIITTRMDFRDYNYKQLNIRSIDEYEIINLFNNYNDIDYSDDEMAAIEKLIRYVEYHTMTIELIAKYLRVSEVSPEYLYDKFMERAGMTGTEDIRVKQRKDKKLRSQNVNEHIGILFDISDFNSAQREIMGSLSLFDGIRISKSRFEEICRVEDINSLLDNLIKRGWIQYNDKNGKISLHQVIQDMSYKDLSPNAENCPKIVSGMKTYIKEYTRNSTERKLRRRLFNIVMNRLDGSSLEYAELCLMYGKEDRLLNAQNICENSDEPKAYDILQKIYRKRIENLVDSANIVTYDEPDGYMDDKLSAIADMIGKVMKYCMKYAESFEADNTSCKADYISKEYIEAADEIDKIISQNIYLFTDDVNESSKGLDIIYKKLTTLYEAASGNLVLSSYNADEKIALYNIIKDFYSGEDCCAVYRNEHFSDIKKAYEYQQIIDNLRSEKMQNEKPAENEIPALYLDDISYLELAEQYEKETRYDDAIKSYKKAYQCGELFYEEMMQSIAELYVRTGNTDNAIKVYKEILDNDKKLKESSDPDINISYSGWICVKLIRLLIEQGEKEAAKAYAQEMVHYEGLDIEDDVYFSNEQYANDMCNESLNSYKEDINDEITYILAGKYYLYVLEDDSNIKIDLWDECVRYFQLLGDSEIQSYIFDFVYEYMDRRFPDDCIVNIIDRIDSWHNETFKEELIKHIIEKLQYMIGDKKFLNNDIDHNQKKIKVFIKLYITMLLRLSELKLGSMDDIKSADKYCNNAKKLYDGYDISDEYMENCICKIQIDVIRASDDCDYEMLGRLQNKCNYIVLAEHQLQEEKYKYSKSAKELNDTKCSDYSEQIEIWENAAEQYNIAGNFMLENKCLENAYQALLSSEKENINMDYTSNIRKYKEIIRKLITVNISKDDKEKAVIYIDKLYQNINKYFDKKIKVSSIENNREHYDENSVKNPDIGSIREYITELNLIGDYYAEAGQINSAMNTYIKLIYLGMEAISDGRKAVEDTREEGVIENILIQAKDSLAKCCENFDGDKTSYQELIEKIYNEYEHREIEFKNQRQ